MLPRRKLTEILVSARVDRKLINLIVEGRSDQIIIRSFCEGAKIPVLIYPVCLVELDCIPAGPGGEKGRVLRVSNHAAERSTKRLCCIVDRDDLPFTDFYLNSHCLMTDLASLDLYSLDIGEFTGYMARRFQTDRITVDVVTRLLGEAAAASLLQWKRVELLSESRLADIENSLVFSNDDTLKVDLAGWVNRSRSNGGTKAEWDELSAYTATITATQHADIRYSVAIHLFDDIVRSWLKSVCDIRVERHWITNHLRGVATYDRLKEADFFQVLSSHCANELATA